MWRYLFPGHNGEPAGLMSLPLAPAVSDSPAKFSRNSDDLDEQPATKFRIPYTADQQLEHFPKVVEFFGNKEGTVDARKRLIADFSKEHPEDKPYIVLGSLGNWLFGQVQYTHLVDGEDPKVYQDIPLITLTEFAGVHPDWWVREHLIGTLDEGRTRGRTYLEQGFLQWRTSGEPDRNSINFHNTPIEPSVL
ncbi:hypothetical protein BDZ91DRAFT_852621 [Kalaharituber pfeilii]|nr:hypothetical protein BDZ91DRAFT_852621 [Kalaharituber pfeilii]